MFDFENLIAYQKALGTYKRIYTGILVKHKLDRNTRDQLQRASLSMVINIAEGTGKYTSTEKRKFYVIARASAYECASLLDILKIELHSQDSLLMEIKKHLYEFTRVISGLILKFSKS